MWPGWIALFDILSAATDATACKKGCLAHNPAIDLNTLCAIILEADMHLLSLPSKCFCSFYQAWSRLYCLSDSLPSVHAVLPSLLALHYHDFRKY